MVCVLTLHIAREHMMTAYSGKNVAQKAAIQAEKALAALAALTADLITNAAYPSYAIQRIEVKVTRKWKSAIMATDHTN